MDVRNAADGRAVQKSGSVSFPLVARPMKSIFYPILDVILVGAVFILLPLLL